MKNILPLILFFCSETVHSQSPPQYEVYAIRFGSSFYAKVSDIAVGARSKDSVEACNMFWLIRGNGMNILVDAGFVSTNKNFISPDSALSRVNLKPSDISNIILTHPHYDHISGIEVFPTSQLWMQKDDYDYFVGAAWQKGGFNGGFNKKDVTTLVSRNLEGKVTVIKGDSIEIFPGIRVYIGSKHTWESQYVVVNTEKGKVILASDNCWFYYNLENLLPIPTYTFDPNAYVKQLKRMKTLQPDLRFIIPGHDAVIFSRFPKVAEGVVRIR